MSNSLLDTYKNVKAITKMIEHATKNEYRTSYHRIGWTLKGATKRHYGHAYWPVIQEDKKGNVVGVLPDRAYQIIDGTFYRCHVDGNDNIYLPYESGALESNQYHLSTRKERRSIEREMLKREWKNAIGMKKFKGVK